MTEKVIYRFDTEETAVYIPESESVVIRFRTPKKVASTSFINGGTREDLEGVFNYTVEGDTCVGLEEFERLLAEKAESLGLDPHKTAPIGTAAKMSNMAVVETSYENLKVVAFVTAGIEGNAGYAGDPAFYFGGEEKVKPGTINVMVYINADVSLGALTRALVTCTEGKTAALLELRTGSRYSPNVCTGTGTDSLIVMAESGSSLYYRGAGHHNKLGELLGKAVKKGVKEALAKQNGLTPAKQHSVTERIKRYGVTEEYLYQAAKEQGVCADRGGFHRAWSMADRDTELVMGASFYAYVMDDLRWGLITEEEALPTARRILDTMGIVRGTPSTLPQSAEATELKKALALTLSLCAYTKKTDKHCTRYMPISRNTDRGKAEK